LVCEDGSAAAIPAHAIPEAEKSSDGATLPEVSPLKPNCILAAAFTLPPNLDEEISGNTFILSGTQNGMVKKSTLSELPGVSANVFTLVKVNEGDRMGWLCMSDGEKDILLLTRNGMAIRFNEGDVRPMGLVAAGVMGMKLQADDQVIGMDLLPQQGEIFMVANDSSAKRVKPEQFPKQGRYGQGVVAWKLPRKVQVVGMSIGKGTTRAGLHLKLLATKTIRFDDAPIQGRTARGKHILDLKTGDQVTEMLLPWQIILSKPKRSRRQTSSRKRTTSRRKSK
jgi:DNA gyrase subunit A